MSPAVASSSEREKKLSAIRIQLHRNIRENMRFRQDAREFIRAIRYLRLRNDELRTLGFLSHLQTALQRVVAVSSSNEIDSSNVTTSRQIRRQALAAAVRQQQQRRRNRRGRPESGSKLLGSNRKMNNKRSPPR